MLPTTEKFLANRLQQVDKLAATHGWERMDLQKNIWMVSYQKIVDGSYVRINIYLTKMTVATALNHPKWGKKQLFRKNVTTALLREIFVNPRVHSGCGYYQKGGCR